MVDLPNTMLDLPNQERDKNEKGDKSQEGDKN